MRLSLHLAGHIEAQRGTLLLWAPTGLALGIAAYFTCDFEPGMPLYSAALTIVVAGLASHWVGWRTVTLVLTVMILIGLGFLNAGWSAHRKAAPVLGWHYYGPVEGRIIKVDRSARGRVRVTLDRVVLRRVSPERTPKKIRVSLHYPRQFVPFEPGRRIILTASLSPPSGPVEPGGFDFQRFAWFRGLGAIGYSRSPVLEIAPPDRQGMAMQLMSLRMALAKGIRSRVGGQAGGFAAAILTGDRSAIVPEMLVVLRNSNLAHLLAISGLHMGLLTGFVFALTRYGLALIPYLALRLPVRKIAAAAAFVVAGAYLLLSGGNIATQRAFVMVSVMLLALMLDRRALSLRAVALAALIVLALRPESLIEAGFQMSFAATTALVTVFGLLRDRGWLIGGGGMVRSTARHILALMLSSAIAGAATAPISAFHFNQIAQYGLLANLASVPVMGFLVMPSAVVAILLLPLGLDAPFWCVMGAGIDWILKVAGWVAALEGAVIQVVKPDGVVLALIALGGLGVVLLRTRLRLAAFGPVMAGFLLWVQTERPDLLISANGRLVGVMGAEGRWLSRAKGHGFVAGSWLENDGDAGDQAEAASRQGFDGVSQLDINGVRVAMSLGKDAEEPDLSGLCGRNALLVAPRVSFETSRCLTITREDLKKLGSIAVSIKPDAIDIKGARQVTGTRLWSR